MSTSDLLLAWGNAHWLNGWANLIWSILPAAIWWAIWLKRNNRIFNNKSADARAVISKVISLLWYWSSSSPLAKGRNVDLVLLLLKSILTFSQKVEVHSTVRKRWLDGDEFIITSMKEVAGLALEGQKALLEKNYPAFATLMNRNFELRRLMFGDDALGAMNIEMVEVARRIGAASKFTGSGGAVVVFCPDGPSQLSLLEDACKEAGFVLVPATVVPSFLNDVDLKTLSSTSLNCNQEPRS